MNNPNNQNDNDKKELPFKVISEFKKNDFFSRAGEIHTKHGIIKTPCFVPVATKADIKLLDLWDIQEIDPQLIVTNTYHLYMKPGDELIEKMGGINEFTSIKTPFITDSGGFQIFSLGQGAVLGESKFKYSVDVEDNVKKSKRIQDSIVKITKDGAHFRSVYDNSKHFMSPEKSIQIQKNIGADIILTLDECPAPSADYEYTKKSLELTKKWELRSLAEHKKNPKEQLLYGIVQGGLFEDLRVESSKFISENDFDGIAIGGAFGQDEMYKTLDWIKHHLTWEKPKHLLGIGTVQDFFEGVKRGVDTFDCVTPTRLARIGYVLYDRKSGGNLKNKFRYRLSRSEYELDKKPLDENCDCKVCRNYTRGYINHLYRSDELLGHKLISYHNVYFFVNLLKKIRQSIIDGTFDELYNEWMKD